MCGKVSHFWPIPFENHFIFLQLDGSIMWFLVFLMCYHAGIMSTFSIPISKLIFFNCITMIFNQVSHLSVE